MIGQAVFSTAVYTAIGTAIDASIQGRTTLYEAPARKTAIQSGGGAALSVRLTWGKKQETRRLRRSGDRPTVDGNRGQTPSVGLHTDRRFCHLHDPAHSHPARRRISRATAVTDRPSGSRR